jgi:hypothetical protein
MTDAIEALLQQQLLKEVPTDALLKNRWLDLEAQYNTPGKLSALLKRLCLDLRVTRIESNRCEY